MRPPKKNERTCAHRFLVLFTDRMDRELSYLIGHIIRHSQRNVKEAKKGLPYLKKSVYNGSKFKMEDTAMSKLILTSEQTAALNAGSTVKLSFNGNNCHVFSKETELSLEA